LASKLAEICDEGALIETAGEGWVELDGTNAQAGEALEDCEVAGEALGGCGVVVPASGVTCEGGVPASGVTLVDAASGLTCIDRTRRALLLPSEDKPSSEAWTIVSCYLLRTTFDFKHVL